KKKRFLFINSFIIIAMASTTVIAFFMPICNVQRFLQRLSNYWIGIALYIFLYILVIDIVRLILRRIKKISVEFYGNRKTVWVVGLIIMISVGVTSVYGILNAQYIRVTNYDVNIEKEAEVDSMKAVLVADLHLGYSIGYKMMEQMLDKINQQEPDVVFIAGDIFDNVYDGIYKPEEIIGLLKQIKTKYGIYACYGNHDVSERLFGGFSIQSREADYRDERMDEFLEEAGIVVLNDEATVIANSVALIGRIDYQKTCTADGQRESLESLMNRVDTDMPVIVLDHQPRDLEEVSQQGVDLMLSGHTHDGQFFPLTIATNLMWKNPYGLKRYNNMDSIVTSGVGVYGPLMRVGSISEICVVNIKFGK
ncbi:MAG: metallophosphoesterase, partial [Lachnospiraceae bacterium]